MELTRKAFLQASFALAAGGILGCGDDESGSGGSGGGTTTGSTTSSTTGSTTSSTTSSTTGEGGGGGAAVSCEDNGTDVAIAGNHGHELVVSADDVAAGVDKTYDITGTSMHSHSVTVTAANFAQLQDNQSITVTSTDGGAHTHDVTVSCA